MSGQTAAEKAISWTRSGSPKQLRGRKMEDVIFGGANGYKPVGMAEVSLTFENGDGSFPPAFESYSELSITRRLFRSGESEYRINNVPCRLKDIQEIFMDTGLGNRAYSIIGQGRIGTIIEQKPEETRVMLEEAAGITKYRKKVEASQRKIEHTETNLQRIEDILGEVKSQIRSLKRQSSKARRYKSICEEIQKLELILYSNTYQQLKEESGSKLKSTEDLVQQELATSTELSILQARIETMHLELEEKNDYLSSMRTSHLHLRERVHKKEAGLESLVREMKMQEELEVRLKLEQDEIGSRLINLKDEKAHLENELEKMKERYEQLKSEISLKDNRLKNRRESLQFVKQEYEKARTELNTGANREVGLNHESDYLKKMLNQVTDSRSRLEKDMNDVKGKMENVLKASERKNRARAALQEKLQEIETAIEQQNMAYGELELIKGRVENELKSAEADLNVAQTRLASLQTLTENFEGYKMGVRTIMKAKDLPARQQGRIFGLVADVIQVAPEYERAVEAALADRLQYIIVESQEDGKQAIAYLKERARGRSSFVPLKDLTENGKHRIEGSQYLCLPDIISVSAAYRPLINALLGDTVLVDNLEEAISAWKNFGDKHGPSGGRPCFVTTGGDLVDQKGVITGGKLAQNAGGLLARKREMTGLEKKTVKYQKQVDDLKLKLEAIIIEAQEKKRAIGDLNEEKWACRDEMTEFDKQLFRLGQELDQLDRLSRKISEDMERNSRDGDKNREELSRIEKELLQSKTACRQEEEYFRKKEIELKESEEEFDQFRDEMSKLKADYRIFEEEQRSLAREMERLDDYADDSMKRLQKIEEEITLGHRRCDECEKRKEDIREQLKGLYDKLKKSEEDVDRADRERQAFQDGIREKEETYDQMRGVIDDLKEQLNRARMEHSEINFKMNNLVEVVREKFSLNLSHVYEQYLEEDFSHSEAEERLEHQKMLKQRLGEVNLAAIKEHEALKERYEFIQNQREDLLNSIESLRTAINKINRTSLEKFKKAFQDVDKKLGEIFPLLFNGGNANLRLTDETKPLDSGVLVEVQPPGKKLSHMGLLSGGEKALVAMALLFSIYMIRPSPFCLLDEVDAPLDEANIDRFNNLLGEIRRASQVIMVTHSRRTMEIVDRLYGITMEKAGMSKVVAVDISGMKERDYDKQPDDQPVLH
ncbi:MAG: chromosome segregation protein SMC [Deltaproteobacteria bacterium]|nr:chromosome segregation protein SMC [Deltaproteobacteria bacterium]